MAASGGTVVLHISVVILISVMALAQDQGSSPPAVVGYELQVFRSGDDPAGEPFIRTTFQISQATCDRSRRIWPPVTINPTSIVWDDPLHDGRVCTMNLSNFFAQIPPASGPYLATLTAV